MPNKISEFLWQRIVTYENIFEVISITILTKIGFVHNAIITIRMIRMRLLFYSTFYFCYLFLYSRTL